MKPHVQLKGPIFIDFSHLWKAKEKKEEVEGGDDDSRPKGDPIAKTLAARSKHKLGEEKISDTDAKKKKIKVYRATPHKVDPKGRLFVDYLNAGKGKDKTKDAGDPKPSRSPEKK